MEQCRYCKQPTDHLICDDCWDEKRELERDEDGYEFQY